MVKTRIFQIAKELNISHTDILSFLKSKKVDVASHMSPVDETVHQMIMAEFSKDRETVERYRKEQVRKEIHDVKLKERQQTTKKLELLSLDDQRDLEKKESEKDILKIGLPHCCMRLATFYGPEMRSALAPAIFIDKAH